MPSLANSEVGAKLGRMPTEKGAIHCPMRRARLMLRDAASLCRTRVAERRHAWHCVCVPLACVLASIWPDATDHGRHHQVLVPEVVSADESTDHAPRSTMLTRRHIAAVARPPARLWRFDGISGLSGIPRRLLDIIPASMVLPKAPLTDGMYLLR